MWSASHGVVAADSTGATVRVQVQDENGTPLSSAVLSWGYSATSFVVNDVGVLVGPGLYNVTVQANAPIDICAQVSTSAATYYACQRNLYVAAGATACITLIVNIAGPSPAATVTPASKPSSGAAAPTPAASPAATAPLQPAPPAPAPTPAPPCRLVLGFRAFHDLLPAVVGACLDDEAHDPQSGDAVQHTTRGLLVWRKAANATAFTDGYRTWVNGPRGVQERLNMQRFAWEANPDGLPVVP